MVLNMESPILYARVLESPANPRVLIYFFLIDFMQFVFRAQCLHDEALSAGFAHLKTVEIFTDGGCLGNPGPGGWAAVLRHEKTTRELSGGDAATTNNRMELQAAISALSALKAPCLVTLHTDSQYLRQGITGWIHGWKKNGWRTKSRQPVKNADLWKSLDQLATVHTVTWQWVKGHAGHPENERCDELAAAEMEKLVSSKSRAELQSSLEAFQAQAKPESQNNQLSLLEGL